MIKIVKYKDTLKLFFNGENFQEILDECRTWGLKFTEENSFKFHTGKPSSFHYAIPEFEKIEQVTFLPNEEVVKDFCVPRLSIIEQQIPYNEELLKFPAKIGKGGLDYQTEALKLGIETNRKLYSLPMGSGKSWIMTNVINHLRFYNKADKFLILVPNHMKVTIKHEIQRFFYDELENEDFYICDTKNRKPFESDCTFVIGSYQNMVMISDDYYKIVTGKKSTKARNNYMPIGDWGTNRCIMVDEIHSIKNNTARQSKTVHKIKDHFNYRYGFSGTIAPNNESELYSSVTFLDDNLIPLEYTTWLKTIADLGNRFSMYAINYFYKDKVASFLKSIEPYMYSRGDEILDLPDFIVEKLYCGMSQKQDTIYKELIKYTLSVIKEETGELKTKDIVNKFPYMKLAVDNPSILKGKIDPLKSKYLYDLIEKWNFKKDYYKLDIIDDLLSLYIKDEKRKVILWDFHPVTIDELAEVFKEYNPLVIHGALKEKDLAKYKEDTVNKFKKSKEHNLLIVNPVMMETGVTIVESTRQIFNSLNFSYTTYAQSSKRIHRIGSKEKVVSNVLLYENSLDLRAMSTIEDKADLNKKLLTKEYLSKEDMQKLFKGELF